MEKAETLLQNVIKRLLGEKDIPDDEKNIPRPSEKDDGEPTEEEIIARLYEHYGKLAIFTKVNSSSKVASNSNIKNPNLTSNSDDAIAYRLAATDLFVEKALDFLKQRAKDYKQKGEQAYAAGILAVAIAVLSAAISLFVLDGKFSINDQWLLFVSHFIAAFTFYGLLVLFAVSAWRFGKAMLDQSERLYEKRHAMRQGRLYVHLKDGNLSIDELERAFTWNASQPNAFSDIPTDAKAPWGAVVTDSLKAVPEIVRAAKGDKP